MTPQALGCFYRHAKNAVIEAGYHEDICSYKPTDQYSESDLLREAAWVILCSGFRESIVRKKFQFISLCYFDWENANSIWQKHYICVHAAEHVFSNRPKLVAIANVAKVILERGFDGLKREIDKAPLTVLAGLPFIGRITAAHLAKNLGYSVAKNDRHLSRLAGVLGFADAQSLCENISALSGESIPIVDSVLWRFCAAGLQIY